MEILDADVHTHCFLRSRIASAGLDQWRLGADIWVFGPGDSVESAVYHGANLVPVTTTARSRAAFADHLRLQQRKCSSLVGPADEVLDLWRLLEPAWGPSREVRARQPLLLIDHEPPYEHDPRVRLATHADTEALVPACIAMFTEEVGVSPLSLGSLSAYRARITELIGLQRVFVIMEDDSVVFKAEVGAWTPQSCQLQGVWVAPEFRGRGLAAGALAATISIIRHQLSPAVSLYVNDFNTPARKAYARVGMRQHEEFATVLLPA